MDVRGVKMGEARMGQCANLKVLCEFESFCGTAAAGSSEIDNTYTILQLLLQFMICHSKKCHRPRT